MQRDRVMTKFTPPTPAPADVQAFIGQVVTDLSAAFSGVLVNVGRKLGLYQAMADMTTFLSDVIGFPHGSECHPHVCRGRSGGQPLGGGGPSPNPAADAEPSNPGPGTATQSAVVGALGARHKTDRRWNETL